MKTLRLTLFALLGFVAVVRTQAAPAKDQQASRVEVSFKDPDKFTDASDGPRGSGFGQEGILSDLKERFISRAAPMLAEGQHLAIAVTDVDLAGEIEPGRTGSGSDIRIIRAVYTPKIDLTYRLTDASGAVIKEGTSRLRDMNFQNNINPLRNEARVYEYALIDRWVSQELRPAKKS
jgi:hypothetical protein